MPRDFSRQNLRGRCFKGQNLEGADFSHADIRGANFAHTKLKGSNFSYTTAGLQRRWVLFLVCVSWTIAVISGFLAAFVGSLIIYFISSTEYPFVGWIALILVIILGIIIIRQGYTIALALAVALAGAVAVALAAAVAGAVAAAVAGAVAAAVAVAVALAGAVAAAGAAAVAGAAAAAGALIVLSAYTAWRSMAGDEKYSLIRSISIACAAMGGTSFYNAELTDANFTGATLKSTDLRNATLIRTCFYHTKGINLLRPGKTYLHNPKLRQLLTTGQGKEQNFDRQDLRGVNLQKATLTDASFIGADLSEASLQDADLSRAKLVQTQLDATDFKGATLTGAYIEDWGITNDTKFDGVRCEYVYMRLPTTENPEPLRKPDNHQEVFADGEFGDFIKPIVDTLDLYHNQGVDPRAIAISLKKLAENHPDAELEIVAMEKRGQDKFLLRAKTADSANKSELSAEYFTTYNNIKELPPSAQLLLAEKDSRIASLENFVKTALQSPIYYSNVERADFMTNNPGGISQSVSGGKMYGSMQAAQGNHNVQTSTTYSSPDEQQTLAEAAAEIQQLLDQLSQSYTDDTSVQIAAKATESIKNNPGLMEKTMKALTAGTTAALEQLLNHPAASFCIAALDELRSKNNQ